MPLTAKGTKILNHMEKEYGAKEGESVFYASKNKGKISGVDAREDANAKEKKLERLRNDLSSLKRSLSTPENIARAGGHVKLRDAIKAKEDEITRARGDDDMNRRDAGDDNNKIARAIREKFSTLSRKAQVMEFDWKSGKIEKTAANREKLKKLQTEAEEAGREFMKASMRNDADEVVKTLDHGHTIIKRGNGFVVKQGMSESKSFPSLAAAEKDAKEQIAEMEYEYKRSHRHDSDTMGYKPVKGRAFTAVDARSIGNRMDALASGVHRTLQRIDAIRSDADVSYRSSAHDLAKFGEDSANSGKSLSAIRSSCKSAGLDAGQTEIVIDAFRSTKRGDASPQSSHDLREIKKNYEWALSEWRAGRMKSEDFMKIKENHDKAIARGDAYAPVQEVSKAQYEQKCRDGEWEAQSDPSSQGLVEVKVNGRTKKWVRVRDWRSDAELREHPFLILINGSDAGGGGGRFKTLEEAKRAVPKVQKEMRKRNGGREIPSIQIIDENDGDKIVHQVRGDADFKESDHPRGGDGTFGAGANGRAGTGAGAVLSERGAGSKGTRVHPSGAAGKTSDGTPLVKSELGDMVVAKNGRPRVFTTKAMAETEAKRVGGKVMEMGLKGNVFHVSKNDSDMSSLSKVDLAERIKRGDADAMKEVERRAK